MPSNGEVCDAKSGGEGGDKSDSKGGDAKRYSECGD